MQQHYTNSTQASLNSTRRLELELQHLKNQLTSEQNALIESQEEREKAERLLNAICNALNDSTTASADVVATLQLAVYRYKDAYVATHGGVSPALMELVNDVEQGVERLNESTRTTQARLSSEDVQVSATEALGNGRVGTVEMSDSTTNSLSRGVGGGSGSNGYSGNSGSSFSGPSPYKGYSGGGDMDGSFTSTSNKCSRNRGGGGGYTDSSESLEIKRLKSQIASLKRTYEEERQRLEHSHKEHLSTLAVALQHDTERAEARAIDAETRVAELDLLSSSLRVEIEMLKNAASSSSSSSSSSLHFNPNETTINASKVGEEGNNVVVASAVDDDNKSSSTKRQEQELLFAASGSSSSSTITSPRHSSTLPHISTKVNSKGSSFSSQVPLSVAGLATVEVLSQLSDAMAKLRPLSPMFSPEGIDASPRPARSRLASPPPKSVFRDASTAAALRLPELAGINDTLASLKAQIEDLEKNTHLVMPDLGSPTYAQVGLSQKAPSFTPTPAVGDSLPPPTPQSAGFKSPLPPPPPPPLYSSSASSDGESSSSSSRQQLEMELWQLRSARRELELRNELDKEAEVEASLRTQIQADAQVEASLRSQLRVENDIESSLRDQVRSEKEVVATVRSQLLAEAEIEASLRMQLSSAQDELLSNADVVSSLRQQLMDRIEVEASLRSLLEDAHAQTASVEESLRETKEALDGVEIELSERRNQLDDARMNAAMAAETSAREHEQIRKEFEDKISALLSSSADLSLQLSNTQSLLTECEKKLVEQKADTDNERNESERVKKELSASQEALSAAFRDMASVDANLTAALESASTLTSRAESAESKCKSLDEEKSKLFSLVEEALLERDRLTNEISLVKAELAIALMKKETVDTGAGGNQVSGFPKEAAVGPDWNDPNEMRVASGDSSAVMALAEGGGGVSSISNISNGDLRVMAYDDTPALRSLVNELKTQASALEIEVNDLRNKLSASLSFGEKSANNVAALELSLKRYTAREEELSTQIANIRRELASAHEAVSSAEKRAAESEMNAERVSMKIAAYQREAETSAMEARVAQEQLSMYLLRQPSGHLSSSSSSSSTSFSSIGGSNGGLMREVVNEEIIQQQKNEIARLEKALESASNRAREEAERVAALTSQGLEQHRLLQRARAEANLKSADVDAHLEGLVASEARARNELNEAKRVAEAAQEEKASVIRILDAVLTDVPKAISSVLGVKVPPEMLQAGESSLVSLLCQSSLVKNSRPEAASNATANLASLPALPPTPFSAYKGGNMSYNNGGGGGASHSNHEHSATAASSSSSSLSINEDDLAREMHAAATQLRLVTLQKAAMAKELTQVYKAVEVLEGNLGKTRRENSKLLATLSAVQSSRRLGSSLTSNIDNGVDEGGGEEEEGGYGQNHDAVEAKMDSMVLPVSMLKPNRGSEVVQHHGSSQGKGQQGQGLSTRGVIKADIENDIVQDGAAMLAESYNNDSSTLLVDAPTSVDQYNRGKNGGISRGVATALTSVFSSYSSSSSDHQPYPHQMTSSTASSSSLMSPAGPFTRGQGAAESARLKVLSTKTLTAKKG
jgi:hypothetical protein